MIRALSLAFFAIVLAACSSKPVQPVAALPKPIIKSIALVPATTPNAYTVDNRNGAIGLFVPGIAAIGYAIENRSKAKTLTEKLGAMQYAPGQELTLAMADALRGYGYSVQIHENVSRAPRSPDHIDYETFNFSADALVHVYFSEIGLYSPPWTVNYLPRVNASGIAFVKAGAQYLYDDAIYFGADSREGKTWAIASDEKYAYANFDVVLNRLELVREGFSVGVKEISKRMAEQIHEAIR